MDLGTYLANKIHDKVIVNRAINKMRAEHDEWARNPQLGTTHYTLKPFTQYDEWTNRPVHLPFTFVKVAKWGMHAGELITDGGHPSWPIWYRYGALTTKRRPTAKDHWLEDEKAFAGFSARAQQQVEREVMAELARLYPASVRHALAAAA